MKLIITGHRDFTNWKTFCIGMRMFVSQHGMPTLIVNGAATGTDALASLWARNHSIKPQEIPAEWETFGNAAGPIRNLMMAKAGADHCLGFLESSKFKNKQSGSYDMLKKANAAGIKTHVILIDDKPLKIIHMPPNVQTELDLN